MFNDDYGLSRNGVFVYDISYARAVSDQRLPVGRFDFRLAVTELNNSPLFALNHPFIHLNIVSITLPIDLK